MSSEKTGISTKFIKSSNFIDKVFKSRRNIIKYLELEGFNCSQFNQFTLNDIHTMTNTKQLDMIVEKDDKKTLVKYHLENAYKEGISKEETMEALSIATLVGGTIVIPHLRRAYEYWEALEAQEG